MLSKHYADGNKVALKAKLLYDAVKTWTLPRGPSSSAAHWSVQHLQHHGGWTATLGHTAGRRWEDAANCSPLFWGYCVNIFRVVSFPCVDHAQCGRRHESIPPSLVWNSIAPLFAHRATAWCRPTLQERKLILTRYALAVSLCVSGIFFIFFRLETVDHMQPDLQ